MDFDAQAIARIQVGCYDQHRQCSEHFACRFWLFQSYTGLQIKLSSSLGLPTANFGDTIFFVWKTQNGVVIFKCGPVNTTLGVNERYLPPGCSDGVDGW